MSSTNINFGAETWWNGASIHVNRMALVPASDRRKVSCVEAMWRRAIRGESGYSQSHRRRIIKERGTREHGR